MYLLNFINFSFRRQAATEPAQSVPCAHVYVCLIVLSFLLHLISVGKTSLITRFMYDSFDNTYQVSTQPFHIINSIILFCICSW